jgi:PhzF family phenazine biosynthesis protein
VSRSCRVRHVCAFTGTAFEGNPAAVVDGDGLDPAQMQRIALNQHLSETVFLLPPEDRANSAKVRIFTPRSELPFAGHPIVATAHILTEERIATVAGGEPLRIETGAGVVPVRVEGTPVRYTMTQASPQFAPAAATAAKIAAALGLHPQDVARTANVSTGIFWTVAQITSFDAMMRMRPDPQELRALMLAAFCIRAQADGADVHVRAFALPQGIEEDPVTGSANGCIGALIARDGLLPARDGEIAYVAEQGVELGQPGRIYVQARPGDQLSVDVGGEAVTTLRGDLLLS